MKMELLVVLQQQMREQCGQLAALPDSAGALTEPVLPKMCWHC